VLAALLDDRARGADGLGGGIAAPSGATAFTLGVEEQVRVGFSARTLVLPFPQVHHRAGKTGQLSHVTDPFVGFLTTWANNALNKLLNNLLSKLATDACIVQGGCADLFDRTASDAIYRGLLRVEWRPFRQRVSIDPMKAVHGGAGPSPTSGSDTHVSGDIQPDNHANGHLNGSSERPAPLTVAGVAQRLGVAASTLRTWDRRYGLGPSAHVAGSHRKYSPDDVARLERMRELTLQGVAPADAARAAVAFDPAHPEASPAPSQLVRERAPVERLLVDPLSLAAAAVEPDPRRVKRMVEQEVEDRGVVRAWTGVGGPALEMLAQREKTDLPGVEPESVLRAAFLTAVRDAAVRDDAAHRRADLVLLCADESQRLQAHVVGGGLAEVGVQARVLRAEVVQDPSQVLDVVDRRRAGVLAVFGAVPGAEDLVTAASERGDVAIFLVGDAAPSLWLPHVHRVRTLSAAVEEMAAAISTHV